MPTTEREYYAEEAFFHDFVPHVIGTRFALMIAGIDFLPADAHRDTTKANLQHLNRVV